MKGGRGGRQYKINFHLSSPIVKPPTQARSTLHTMAATTAMLDQKSLRHGIGQTRYYTFVSECTGCCLTKHNFGFILIPMFLFFQQ